MRSSMLLFMGDRRGSAVRWFALAAVAVSAASLLGARGLEWLSQSGRVALVAYRAPAPAARTAEVRRAANDPGVDMTPTGSVPAGTGAGTGAGDRAGNAGSNALVIRIR